MKLGYDTVYYSTIFLMVTSKVKFQIKFQISNQREADLKLQARLSLNDLNCTTRSPITN